MTKVGHGFDGVGCMKYGDRVLAVGDVSDQGKEVIAVNLGSERHRGYRLRCVRCGYETDTSKKSFHNNCKKCGSVRKNVISVEGHLWHKYRHSAKSRGLEFDLTIDEFSQIVRQDCHYCGDPPSQELVVARRAENRLTYNGIDRLDNANGYVIGNVVPCCWPCNQAKRGYTVSEFKDMVDKWKVRCESWAKDQTT